MAIIASKHHLLSLLIAQAIVWGATGCAPPASRPALPASGAADTAGILQVPAQVSVPLSFSAADMARIRQAFVLIDEQNRTVKRSPKWIEAAYHGLGIRHYRSLDAAALEKVRSFVRDKEVYIIVHPAYYTFFMHDYAKLPVPADDPTRLPRLNLAERLYAVLPRNVINYRIMWEEERLVRDFLEYMSAQKRLVILALPRDFRTMTAYHSPRGLDEYTRFLNDVTNMSESTLYLETKTWDRGTISKEEASDLKAFLEKLGVTKVYLGGGYLGKCLDNFYDSLRAVYAYGNVVLVPELTTISPPDMVAEALDYFDARGRLKMSTIRHYFDLANDTVFGAEEKIPLENFPLYPVYEVR